MYFYKSEGKQILDMSGNFVLSKHKYLVMAKSMSASPHAVKNANYIPNIGNLTFKKKLQATFLVIGFIWS